LIPLRRKMPDAGGGGSDNASPAPLTISWNEEREYSDVRFHTDPYMLTGYC
jgi:hypothetical protein